MPVAPTLHVCPVTPGLADAVRALRVASGQYAYVGDVACHLVDAAGPPGAEAMAILAGDAVVGFYRIEHRVTVVTLSPLGPAAVGLRSFLIDRDWQGRGLGARAMQALCDDLARRYPQARVLALNVNCGNVAAIRAYRRAGFVDTGEIAFGGSAGPQRLMLRHLPPAAVGESAHG